MMLEWQVEMLLKGFDYHDENNVLLALHRHNVWKLSQSVFACDSVKLPNFTASTTAAFPIRNPAYMQDSLEYL